MKHFTTAEEAVKIIKSGDNVYIHSVAAAPQLLIKAMTERAAELQSVEIFHLHTEGAAPYAAPEFSKSFHVNPLFIGANVRENIQSGRGDYIPNFLSEVPSFFKKGIIPIDVALIHVSPPDVHGFCSLGVSVEVTHTAVQIAKHVIAQVNPNMPRTYGDSTIHLSKFDAIVACHDPIIESEVPEIDNESMQIAKNVASLIEDGSCLQLGIGSIPNAVLKMLDGHKNLGIHSEMFSDGVVDLAESGVINGKYKVIRPEKIVAGFVMGTRKVYDFIHDNPMVEMLDISYVNDTSIIRRNPKTIAINSAIEVDLTGQVCADSIGKKMYSGVGGQMDFIRGASLSDDGKPIIALSSQTAKGISRIVPFLKEGAGVVTTRAHVHYVVTEYGIANLYGKNLHQRAIALINIAHPTHREQLEKDCFYKR